MWDRCNSFPVAATLAFSIHTCTCEYTHAEAHTYTYTSTYMHIHVYTWARIHTSTRMHMWEHTHMYIHEHTYRHVHTWAHVHTHIHMSFSLSHGFTSLGPSKWWKGEHRQRAHACPEIWDHPEEAPERQWGLSGGLLEAQALSVCIPVTCALTTYRVLSWMSCLNVGRRVRRGHCSMWEMVVSETEMEL